MESVAHIIKILDFLSLSKPLMFLVGQFRMATMKELWDNAWTLFNYFTCKSLILKNFNLFSMFVAL